MDELIKQYIELKTQEEEIKAKKDVLSNQIKELLEKEPDMKYSTSDYVAKLIEKTNFSYNDETAIINYITAKGLSDIYLTKKINTSKLNSELKNKGSLYNATKQYLTENIVKALDVRANKN